MDKFAKEDCQHLLDGYKTTLEFLQHDAILFKKMGITKDIFANVNNDDKTMKVSAEDLCMNYKHFNPE